MDEVTITKPQLQAAMLRWEQDHRDGKCKTYDECLAMPVEDVAAESADWLYAELVRNHSKVSEAA